MLRVSNRTLSKHVLFLKVRISNIYITVYTIWQIIELLDQYIAQYILLRNRSTMTFDNIER